MEYGPPGARFRLGERLVARLPELPQGRWAILTAWNPGGLQRQGADNHQSDARLRRQLTVWQLPLLRVVNGSAPHAEPGWLVGGLSLADGLRLARAYGQLAFVWGVGQRVALVQVTPTRVRRRWVQPADQ